MCCGGAVSVTPARVQRAVVANKVELFNDTLVQLHLFNIAALYNLQNIQGKYI